MGANLSPGVVLSAYEQGLFPWYNPGEPILWWNPPRRAVILPGKLHVSRSMKRRLRRGGYTVTFDRAFVQVIRACQTTERPGQGGTWITDEMLEAYIELHRLGYARSVEVWSSSALSGGLYGLKLGRAFFGESMFSAVPDASKIALIELYRKLTGEGMVMIDCQIMNPHLLSMGAEEISREEYLQLLDRALNQQP